MNFSILDFMVLLMLCLCYPLQIEATVACQSSSLGGVCKLHSGQCKADAISSCFQRDHSGSYIDNIDGVTVTRCRTGRGGFVYPCDSSSSFSGIPPSVLTDVNAQVVSFDPDYYSVSVSWTAQNVSDYFDGYQVSLYEKKTKPLRKPRIKRCVCIANPNRYTFDFVYLNYEHDINRNITVEVLPYPLPASVHESFYASKSGENIKPKGCADAFVGNDSVCNVKRYGAAKNITVQSGITCNDTKELHISWEHPSVSSGGPHPPSYYLYIFHERSRKHIFKVDNTTSVLVRNLNASLEYKAQLQAYGKCSGLGDVHVSLEYYLGCGRTSFIVKEGLSLDKCDKTLPASTTTDPSLSQTTPADDKDDLVQDPIVDSLQ